MAVLAPFFPHEASKKGMTESVSGGVFSVYALVIMISSPLFGKLIPVTGPKILLVVGVFVSGSSNILFGFLDRLDGTASFTAACFIVRSLEGFGAAAFSTASYTYIMHSFPDDVSAAFGLTETFIGIGETIGPAVGSGLYSLGGYGLPFYVLGALVLLTVPLCYFKMQKIDPYRAPAPKTATNGSTHDTYRQTSNEKTKLITKSSKTVKIEANAQVVVRHKSSYKNLLKIPEVIIVCIVVVIVSQSQGMLIILMPFDSICITRVDCIRVPGANGRAPFEDVARFPGISCGSSILIDGSGIRYHFTRHRMDRWKS